jgi:hypothetical protein
MQWSHGRNSISRNSVSTLSDAALRSSGLASTDRYAKPSTQWWRRCATQVESGDCRRRRCRRPGSGHLQRISIDGWHVTGIDYQAARLRVASINLMSLIGDEGSLVAVFEPLPL